MIGCPMRPAPMTPTVLICAGSVPRGSGYGAAPGLPGREDNALLRVDVNDDCSSHRGSQRRMLAREERPRSDAHAKINRLAEKYLLLHRALPDVLAGSWSFGQLDVFRPD